MKNECGKTNSGRVSNKGAEIATWRTRLVKHEDVPTCFNREMIWKTISSFPSSPQQSGRVKDASFIALIF